MSDEQDIEVEPTIEVEQLTIISHSGPRRVLVPSLGEYRDIGVTGATIGAMVIDDRDPAYSYMREWAERTLDVEIVGVKSAVRVCPVCDLAVGSQDELAEHVDDVHIDNGEEEETGRPRRSASPRALAERTERRERVKRATGA
jgi:hypothetical protein